MKYQFEEIIYGISKYINDEIYPGMSDWQELFARVAVSRLLNDEIKLREMVLNNGFLKTFGVIDADGKFDIDDIAKDIKNEIHKKGKMSFTIPMFGKLTFTPDDVNVLYKTITGQDLG